MGQLDGSRILNAFFGLFSKLDATDEALVKTVIHQRKVRVYLTDGGTAATAQTATAFFTNDTGGNIRVVKAVLITPVAVTANGSNNLTCTLAKVDAAGINPATVAAYTSDVAGGSTVALAPKTLSPTNTNVLVANGFSLTGAVSKAGSGVAFAAPTSQAYLEVTYEPVA